MRIVTEIMSNSMITFGSFRHPESSARTANNFGKAWLAMQQTPARRTSKTPIGVLRGGTTADVARKKHPATLPDDGMPSTL